MRNLPQNITQVAIVPASVYGEPFQDRFWVTVNGDRRFRLVQGRESGRWYGRSAGGAIVRLGGRAEVERWITDSLLAERAGRAGALH